MLVPYIFSVLALYSCSNILLETQKFKHTHTHTHMDALKLSVCHESGHSELDPLLRFHRLNQGAVNADILIWGSEYSSSLNSYWIALQMYKLFFFFLAFYGGSTDLLVAPPEKFIAICFLPQGWRQYLSLWLLPSKEENSAYKGFIGLAQDH